MRVDKAALTTAATKLRRLRLTDVGGRKENPADTVSSVLDRGFRDAGSQEAVEYILKHGVKYYLEAVEDAKSTSQ